VGRGSMRPFSFRPYKTDNVELPLVLEWLLPTAQYPRNFPRASLHPGREATMSDPTWQDLFNAALIELDLAKLPERVETARQAIHQYRVQKGLTLGMEERDNIDEALRVLFTLMQRRA
jgi:hypothetical protein